MAQLWGGRFTKATDQMVYDFNASIGFDQKLFAQDVRGSRAHVKMLAKVGVITEGERDEILKGLDGIEADVLYGVHHLVDAVAGALEALCKDGIRLVEEEDRGLGPLAAHLRIGVEHAFHYLLGVPDPLALELGHVHREDVSAGAAGELVYAGGLSGAGTSGEKNGEALAHAHLLETLLDPFEVRILEEAGQALHLLGLFRIVEEAAGLDGFRLHDIGPLVLTLADELHVPEELLDEMDLDMSELPEGMGLGEMYLEFTEDSKMKIYVSLDMSGLMYLDDNAGFYMSGVTIGKEFITNYGDSLMISVGDQENIIFERIGDPDKSTYYGKYSAEAMFGSADEGKEYIIDFKGPKQCFIEVFNESVYNFDEAAGKLSLEGRAHSADVEFSGDKMYWTTEAGEKVSFDRIS